MDPNLVETNQKTQDTLVHLQRDLSTIRAGRANPTLLEDILVEAYDGKMKMVEVGTITAPQPSLLTVQVWDPSIVKDVEKAIMSANLGLNPSVDGQIVRVPIPPLTEERREEFVKVASQKGEAAKVTIRQLRNDQRDEWKKQEEAGEIGEDELFRREKLLQDLVDRVNNEVDSLVKEKQEELRQI
jgi:ribosome recycling factor